jgi:hypothetical protein
VLSAQFWSAVALDIFFFHLFTLDALPFLLALDLAGALLALPFFKSDTLGARLLQPLGKADA